MPVKTVEIYGIRENFSNRQSQAIELLAKMVDDNPKISRLYFWSDDHQKISKKIREMAGDDHTFSYTLTVRGVTVFIADND